MRMLEPTSPTTVKGGWRHPTGAGQTCFRQRSRTKLLIVAATQNVASGKSLKQLLSIILIMNHKHAINSTETISNDLHQHLLQLSEQMEQTLI